MSVLFPKRVKDLPPLEPDSEDDRTPAKRTDVEQIVHDKNRELFSVFRIPRRVSELPPLESDSDDDDNKNDRLNYAIINESLNLSPNINDETLSLNSKENYQKWSNQRNDTISEKLLEDVQKLAVGEKVDVFRPQRSSIKSRQALLPILEAATIIPKANPSEEMKVQECDKDLSISKTDDSMELFRSISVPANVIPVTNPECMAPTIKNSPRSEIPKSSPIKDVPETPYRNNDPNFITPQVKSFQIPSSKRAKPFNSSTCRKTRIALASEFRSQKILFQTPIPAARPLISPLHNDSLTLSIDETLNIDKMVKEKLSSVKEIPKALVTNEKESKESSILINGREYYLSKKIGSGGSSSVYLALRKDNQTEFAIKIVDLKGDPAVVQGYLNETRLLAKLQGNVNVVCLHEYEHLPKESTLYMVMEKGESDLHKILQSYKTDLPLYDLMRFWHQMLEAVKYIHENGVIHSDLKPANFLMANGRLKLIDFGIASNIAIDSTSIIKFSQAGTFNYISPEALIDTSTGSSPIGRNRPKIKISTKSDVWSLGCILYLLLYKRTPFGHILNVYAKVNAISNPQTQIEYPELPPYYPAMLVDMARKCLKYNTKERISVVDLLKYPFHMIIPIEKV